MFVNFTHPSQIRDKKYRRTVKAFTSTHNQRRKRVDRRQELQEESTLSTTSSLSTDDEDESTASSKSDSLRTTTRASRHENEPDMLEQLSTGNSESAAEEIGEILEPSKRNVLVLFDDNTPEEVLDLYPDTGNISPPYSRSGLRPREIARLCRLTQFYIETDGPQCVWRPQQLFESSTCHLFKRNFFALSMTEPLVMESIWAGGQRRLDLRKDPNAEPSAFVLLHRGRMIKMIHERLLNPEVMLDDAVFFGIIGMITLDAFCGNWVSFKSNLDGFLALAVLRGGVENLGWQGWFQTLIGWAELRWAIYTSENDLSMSESPTYPTHPFPSHLSLSVSKLPMEISEAALSEILSVQVLNFFHDTAKWIASYNGEMKGQYYLTGLRLTAQGTALMAKYDISCRERILCIGTLAYIIQTDGGTREGRAPRGLERYFIGIKTLHSDLVLDDGLLWAAVVIAASDDDHFSPSKHKWDMLDCILDSDHAGELTTWKHVKKRTRRMFWNIAVEKSWEKCWKSAIERRQK